MFGKEFVQELVKHSAESEADRRNFLKGAGVAGLGVVGAAAGANLIGSSASAAPRTAADEEPDAKISDGSILNFALNLEYLEGEFYHHAVYGNSLPDSVTGGKGGRGGVVGGRKVPFRTKIVRDMATEIAHDERHHVHFLRSALGNAKVGRPAIDLKTSFTAAARAAGLIKNNQTFDPFANENNFLLGAFIFEDVGVTAYKGAAPLISNSAYLEAAAGILAVEAYHAGGIRTLLFDRGLGAAADRISIARDKLDGKGDDDQGVIINKKLHLVPADKNAIAFSRTPGQVLNIVYLNPKKTRRGGFFPSGVRGSINTSG